MFILIYLLTIIITSRCPGVPQHLGPLRAHPEDAGEHLWAVLIVMYVYIYIYIYIYILTYLFVYIFTYIYIYNVLR